ncbi:Major facilitator superfamily domain-containing protein 6-A [Daphnia sinensis]|uniref:Major facilitator superfamily domain-containing protein 6-A n=1 Tax=Daphnia sinensis TaxID=1820382 RepID=A0AAD5KI09_9CRUS|nr:Major facilitator superfamily domain-containing protein 6-A [Daphnia sinensis]
MTTSTQQEPSVWWLRMACFFFFAGLSCYTPLLAAHLQWLGFDLQEIGIINLIASTGAALGLLLAATWTPRYGHRSNLAVAVLMAAFCGAGLILVPRLNERLHGRSETERPVAEILCRPEGSALFFRKCGDTCELDAVARTELSVSDCRFEPQSRLPVHFIDWINRFALTNINGGKGSDGADDDLSEPERGDLPQKIPVQPSGFEDQFHPSDVETDETLLPGQSGNPPSGVAPYEYDYDENHRLDDVQEIERRRRKRQSIPLMDDAGQLPPALQIDDEFEIAEKADLPYTSSPHICFSSYSSSTTTCHVFTGTNHLFRFNTSFYSGITHNGQCFYSLNYDDVDNQILSELRCRSNKPNHQVRCRAEGMKLRASVTRNGTSTCHGRAPDSNFHLVFWLYLIFRTCGEMAIIATVLLLRIVTLSEDHDGAVSASGWMTQRRSSLVLWWMWALFGLVAMAPLAGWIADVVSFGIAFLLGSVMLGLTAFCIALSPNALPPRPHPMLEATLASIEDEPEDSNGVTPPLYRIRGRDLRAILSDGTAVLILLFMSLLGMAAAVNPTIFYWHLLELGSTRLMLGASVTAQWLPVAPLVLLLSGWLWKRCGHRYIFIIGLLLYSIRFLGYTMLDQYVWIVVIETLEPLCSLWMLLTAAARIERLECRYRDVGIGRDRWHSWKVNTWALVILFHYSIGRALGGLVSSLAAHHFGLVRVFVGAALICLFVAACWFLWIHLKSPCQSRRRKNFKIVDNTSPSSPKETAEPPRRRNEAEQERKQKLLRSSPV